MSIGLKGAALLMKAAVADDREERGMPKLIVKLAVFAALGAIAFLNKEQIIEFFKQRGQSGDPDLPEENVAAPTAPESTEPELGAVVYDDQAKQPAASPESKASKSGKKTSVSKEPVKQAPKQAPEIEAKAPAPTPPPPFPPAPQASPSRESSGKVGGVAQEPTAKAPAPAPVALPAKPEAAPKLIVVSAGSEAPPKVELSSDTDKKTFKAMEPFVIRVKDKDGRLGYSIDLAKVKEVSTKAILDASKLVGVDAGFMYTKALVESQLRPYSVAGYNDTTLLKKFYLGTKGVVPPSSAKGMFQFIDASHKEQLAAARKLYPKADLVDDPFDPFTSAVLAAVYVKKNIAVLNSNLKRKVDLGSARGSVAGYLTHFLGGGGATTFFKAYDANPKDLVSKGMSAAQIKANPNLAYTEDKKGNKRLRTLREFYDVIAAKFSGRAKNAAELNAKAGTKVAEVNLEVPEPADDRPPTAVATAPVRGPQPETVQVASSPPAKDMVSTSKDYTAVAHPTSRQPTTVAASGGQAQQGRPSQEQTPDVYRTRNGVLVAQS